VYFARIAMTTCLLLAWAVTTAGAQVEPSSQPTADRKPASASQADNVHTVSSPLQLQQVDPEIGVFLTGEAARKFREWLNTSEGLDYSITSIALVGKVETDDRAELTATITVQVNRDNRSLRVPLNLNEATLRDPPPSYRGKGQAYPDSDFKREAGYHWWFRGKGEHVLTLSLIVPVRKQLPTRRLQLSIPRTAVSKLKLHVPDQRLSTKHLPEDAWVRTTPSGKSGTNIEVQWVGPRLDLSWQPLPGQKPVETVLQSNTDIRATVSGESVLLEATQRIQARQGNFSEVRVRLPSGFQLVEVEGNQNVDHQVSTDNHVTHVTVQLTEPTTGPLDLKWTLDSQFPNKSGTLAFDGFEVDRARQQFGTIAISGLEGYQLSKLVGKNVRRTDAGPAMSNERINTAYKFYKQPFHLALELAEVEPRMTVTPNLRMRMTPERADLDAVFQFEVYYGAAREIILHWPNARKEGWTLDTVGPPTLLDRDQSDERLNDGVLRIPFLQRTKGTFTVHLKASRPIDAAKETLNLSLPYVKDSPRQPTRVTLFSADNLVVQLSAEGETSLRPLLVKVSGSVDDIPADFRDLRRREAFQIDSLEHTFSATTTLHEQQLTTSSTATVELEQDRLAITQRIRYDVAFERLSQIRMLVPEALQKRVSFTTDDGQVLTPNSTLFSEGTLKEVRLMLSDEKIGEFDVTARFFVDMAEDLSPGRSAVVTIPLVQSSDAGFISTTVRFQHQNRIDAVLNDEDSWKPQSTMDNSTGWSATGPMTQIRLKLSHSRRQVSQDYLVRKALIRSVLDQEGRARTRAQYRIDGAVSTIALKLPHDRMAIETVWWNQRQLSPAEIVTVGPDRGDYRLEVAQLPQVGEHLLTVDYHSTQSAPPGHAEAHQLSAPEFAENVWVEESVWQVSLRDDRLLFTNPRGFTAQFRWQRNGFIWSRERLTQTPSPLEWISATDGPAEQADFSQPNTYLFSRFGPASGIEFRAMSLPLIVLFGAGLSLVAGFVLLFIPMTRNVLTFLMMVFAVALVGMWYPAPVQLLLQPALLGLLLAVVTAFINGILKRDKHVPLLTLSSPSDFATPAPSTSSVDRPSMIGACPEEPTIVRPVAGPVREPISSAESGSHA